jgi:hypothetical protein
MGSKTKAQPFCPKCGKQEFVTLLSEYLDSWKCTSCQIQFDFSALLPIKAESPKSGRGPIIGPAKFIDNYDSISIGRIALGPARVRLSEQDIVKNLLKPTKHSKTLVQTNKLQAKTHKKRKGNI